MHKYVSFLTADCSPLSLEIAQRSAFPASACSPVLEWDCSWWLKLPVFCCGKSGTTITQRHLLLCAKDFLPVWDNHVLTQSFITARCYAERGYEIACRPSVCLWHFRYCDHIGWNSSKIISRPNRLRPVRSLYPTWAIWCNGNTPKIRVE